MMLCHMKNLRTPAIDYRLYLTLSVSIQLSVSVKHKIKEKSRALVSTIFIVKNFINISTMSDIFFFSGFTDLLV
jgi:hypothetical protein